MNKLKYFMLIIGLAVLLSAKAQQNVRGSGYVLTQQRETKYFNSIEVSNGITVILVQGEMQPIIIEADDNLFPYIKTIIRDQVLKIYIPDTVHITKYADMNVLISMPTLLSLQATTQSKISASSPPWRLDKVQIKAATGSHIKLHGQATSIQVNARTSSIVELKGNTQELEINLTTAAQLYARELKVRNAFLRMATGAKAEIYVYGNLKYNLYNNSRLLILGKPSISDSQATSNSKVIRKR